MKPDLLKNLYNEFVTRDILRKEARLKHYKHKLIKDRNYNTRTN